MAKICQRPYSVTVEPGFVLGAYWDFEEDYPGGGFDPATWYDRINSLEITGFKADWVEFGKIGHARDSLNWNMAAVPEMGWTDGEDGFSLWFWFKKSAPAAAPTSVTFLLDMDTGGGDPQASFFFILSPALTRLRCRLETYDPIGNYETDLLDIIPPTWMAEFNAGDWVFFGLTWSASDGLFRVYMNGSAPVPSVVPVSMYSIAQGFWRMSYAGTGNIYVDEFGYSRETVASDAQMLALYNGGSGLTWPDVQNP